MFWFFGQNWSKLYYRSFIKWKYWKPFNVVAEVSKSDLGRMAVGVLISASKCRAGRKAYRMLHSPVRSVDLFKRCLSLLNSRFSLCGGDFDFDFLVSVGYFSKCALRCSVAVLFLGKANPQWSSIVGWFGLKKSYNFSRPR